MSDRIPGSSWSNPVHYREFMIGPTEDNRNPRTLTAIKIFGGVIQVEYEGVSVESLKHDIDKHWRLLDVMRAEDKVNKNESNGRPMTVEVDHSLIQNWSEKFMHRLVEYVNSQQYFRGLCIAVFYKIDGKTIRCTVENSSGQIHILNPDDLTVIEDLDISVEFFNERNKIQAYRQRVWNERIDF